jgi:hypothetical protein
MRRFAMAGAVLTMGTVLGVLAPAAGGTAAWADGPRYVTIPLENNEINPAGTLCDFTYQNLLTGTDREAIFPDKTIDHLTLHATHINKDTGFTLTETDHFTLVTAGGHIKEAGVQWHLRTADGKIVVVDAGKLVFTPTFDAISFTPNTNPDFAAVVCPALGGQPAS